MLARLGHSVVSKLAKIYITNAPKAITEIRSFCQTIPRHSAFDQEKADILKEEEATATKPTINFKVRTERPKEFRSQVISSTGKDETNTLLAKQAFDQWKNLRKQHMESVIRLRTSKEDISAGKVSREARKVSKRKWKVLKVRRALDYAKKNGQLHPVLRQQRPAIERWFEPVLLRQFMFNWSRYVLTIERLKADQRLVVHIHEMSYMTQIKHHFYLSLDGARQLHEKLKEANEIFTEMRKDEKKLERKINALKKVYQDGHKLERLERAYNDKISKVVTIGSLKEKRARKRAEERGEPFEPEQFETNKRDKPYRVDSTFKHRPYAPIYHERFLDEYRKVKVQLLRPTNPKLNRRHFPVLLYMIQRGSLSRQKRENTESGWIHLKKRQFICTHGRNIARLVVMLGELLDEYDTLLKPKEEPEYLQQPQEEPECMQKPEEEQNRPQV